MELQWRFRARVVAYIDLVLSILGLIGTLLVAFAGVVTAVAMSDDEMKEKMKQEFAKNPEHKDLDPDLVTKLTVWGIWIAAVIMAIVTVIQLWAVIMLLKATRENCDPKQALHRALIWRNVTVVFFVISVISYLLSLSFISLALTVLFRGILLYIVCNFIKELDQAAAGGGAVFLPNAVVVNK